MFASEVVAESEQACLGHTCMSIRIARSPLAATFEIQVGPIWSHFGRPMLSHRHPRHLKSPKMWVTSGCRFFTYATCSVAWFAYFIVMVEARSMTEIRGGTPSVIRIRLTDRREEQRVVQVCHLQRMGVKNAYPSSESASKMRTLRQKVELRDGIEPPSGTPLPGRVKC